MSIPHDLPCQGWNRLAASAARSGQDQTPTRTSTGYYYLDAQIVARVERLGKHDDVRRAFDPQLTRATSTRATVFYSSATRLRELRYPVVRTLNAPPSSAAGRAVQRPASSDFGILGSKYVFRAPEQSWPHRPRLHHGHTEEHLFGNWIKRGATTLGRLEQAPRATTSCSATSPAYNISAASVWPTASPPSP